MIHPVHVNRKLSDLYFFVAGVGDEILTTLLRSGKDNLVGRPKSFLIACRANKAGPVHAIKLSSEWFSMFAKKRACKEALRNNLKQMNHDKPRAEIHYILIQLYYQEILLIHEVNRSQEYADN